MKKLYLDCGMGAAGDMLTAALLEICPDRAAMLKRLNGMGIPDVDFRAVPSVKCGITGTHMEVFVNGHDEHDHDKHDHEHDGHDHIHAHAHAHAGMEDIRRMIGALNVPEAVKADALAVYGEIAGAESRVHGVPVAEIHFHEVGSKDAVADVTAVSLLLHELAPDEIVASPVRTGFGQVRCAHGILPVPAPATALLLQGIPTFAGDERGEMCTPTGAALLKHFAARFAPQPMMAVEKTGYGMGRKDFQTANCVRAFFGEQYDAKRGSAEMKAVPPEKDEVVKLECNLDDMTPEAVSYAAEALLSFGALDVFTLPAGMKKGRPGILLTCIARKSRAEETAAFILTNTTTLGVREIACRRYTLERSESLTDTSFGPVHVKTSEGYGTVRKKAEYDDLAAIARRTGKPFPKISAAIEDEIRKN